MTQSQQGPGDNPGMNRTPAQQSMDVMSQEFASKVKTLLSNLPRPMFDSPDSLIETINEAGEQFSTHIGEFDEATAEVEGRDHQHLLNVLTSAVLLTHQIALETAADLDGMLPAESATNLWLFMRENVGPIDHHLITPGVLGAAAALQSRILWEAAISVHSASLAIASTFVRIACNALESAVTHIELSDLAANSL